MGVNSNGVMAADDGYSKLERTLVDLAVWVRSILSAVARSCDTIFRSHKYPQKLGPPIPQFLSMAPRLLRMRRPTCRSHAVGRNFLRASQTTFSSMKTCSRTHWDNVAPTVCIILTSPGSQKKSIPTIDKQLWESEYNNSVEYSVKK